MMNAVEEKERGEKRRKEKEWPTSGSWKSNFTVEAKTQKEELRGRCGPQADAQGDQSLLGKLIANDYS